MTKEEENQYRRDTYHWRKAHKMCARCGKQDAYTLNGRSKCCECCEKEAENRRKNYDPEKEREKKQRQYAKREAEGRCVRCGRIKSNNGCKICNKCVAEKRQYNQEKSQDIRVYRYDLNLCWFCGGQLDGQKKFDGTKSRICSKCYESRLPYMRKAIEQSIKNREERKLIMNTQEIIDGYHAAEHKIAYIAKLSRDCKIPKSTIIAELFKSGYKYEEIKRSLKAEYAAAEKKHQQWIEAGKPETLYSEESVQEEEPVKETKETAEETKEELEKLLKDNIRLLNENETLWKENQDAKKAIEVLRSDKDELTKAIETQRLCIDRMSAEKASLETRLETLTKNHEMAYQRISELEADNKDLEVRINDAKQDAEDLRNQGAIPCEARANDAINDLINARQEIDWLIDNLDTATKMYLKERKKRKKLKKALLKLR